jgi:nucleoid-associated protein YgaU
MNVRALLCGAAALLFLSSCDRPGVDALQFVERGMLQVQNEQFPDALSLYQKALEVDPGCDAAWLQLALLYDDFLNDKSNAVVAYRQYIELARNDATKERAERWLAAAEADLNFSRSEPANGPAMASREVTKALEQRERQFKLLRTEMINRYEEELEELRQELMDAQERVATIETENTIFRGRDPNGDVADLFDRIASNEQIIAVQQMQVEQCMEDADEMYRGNAGLQSLVTNLQTELRDARVKVVYADALAGSNALLMAECNLGINRLRALEEERNGLQLKLKALEESAAQSPAVATVVVTNEIQQMAAAAVVTQVTTVASVAMTAETTDALNAATNEIAGLQKLVDSHAAERDNHVGILESLRQVVADRDQELTAMRAQVAQLQDVSDASVELAQAKALLEQEQEARARNDKLLYERTVQYKRLVQNYEALRTQYANEIEQRRRLSDYLARVQREMSGGQVSTRPVAQAGVVPTQPRTSYAANTAAEQRESSSPVRLPSQASVKRVSAADIVPTIEPLTPPIDGRFYKVQPGDSLTRISRNFYGDPDKWTLIYNENRSILERPNQLRVGQTLRIP